MVIAPAVARAHHHDCYLKLTEYRSGRELARLVMREQPVRFSVEFIHSVLGTRVSDRYEMRYVDGRWLAYLIEESFQGQGYGLPYGATSPGENFERVGDGWRLSMQRVVDPLVQLPIPEQKIDLVWPEGRVRLANLSKSSIQIILEGCQRS